MARQIAIVGGGWAGLAAAVELCTAGARVTLFESARQLGGRARSADIDGRTLDNGQHILLGAYRETLGLLRRVGVAPATCLQRLPLDWHFPRDRFRLRLPRLPAPWHLAAGLALARGCAPGDKLRAARFLRALQASDYRLAADFSVAALLDRHAQHGPLRRLLWEPLCFAALNTAPANASAQVFANVLRESLGGRRADTDLLLPTRDLDHVLPEAAARFVAAHGGTIRLSSRVATLDATLSIDDQAFDGIIVAVAPQHAARLLAGLPAAAATADLLATYTYEPIGCAYLGYAPDFSLPQPMLGLESRHSSQPGQWVFDRGTLCAQPGLLSFVLSAGGAWEALDDEALCAQLHQALEAALGRRLPPPSWRKVLREKRATFACRPGLPRPPAKTGVPDLWLAGDYVYADFPGTLEGAVRSGLAAARGILDAGAPA